MKLEYNETALCSNSTLAGWGPLSGSKSLQLKHVSTAGQRLTLPGLPWSPAPPPQSFHFSAHSSHSYSGDLSHNSCRVQTGQLLCLRAGLDEQKSPGGKPGLHWRRDRSLNSRTAAHTSALSSLEPPGQPLYVLGVPEAVWAPDLGSR